MDYAREIAKAALDIKAIKLSPDKPFEWASGYRMPIYNDNRMFLFDPCARALIADGFKHLIHSQAIHYDVIAGTSTSGIPWGALLANEFASPFIYVRDKPKDHGLQNQIEGIDADLPNTYWVVNNHQCLPIYYGWKYSELELDELKSKLMS